jgi:hypothetical protein
MSLRGLTVMVEALQRALGSAKYQKKPENLKERFQPYAP